MAALSKYYSDIMKSNKVTCSYVMHPNTSCTYFLLANIPITLFRVSQFFLPLYFLPMLANYNNLTKEKLYEVLELFASSVITGGLTVYIAFVMICFLSNIFGNTSFWKLIPIPAMVGGLTIFFATDKVRQFFSHSISIVVLDILVRDGSIWPLRMLREYSSIRTLLFMILSGVIVDSMYLNSDSVFWLFKPLKKDAKCVDSISTDSKPLNRHRICHHKNSCNAHISQVFKTYLIVGIVLEILKAFFGNFGSIVANPATGLFHAIKHIKPNVLLFISGYPTLTNITNCLLNHWLQKSTRLNQNVAAVVGGLPFYFCANELPFIGHTVATAAESMWYRYKRYSNPDTKTYQWLTRIPFAKLVYIFGGSFMYTSRLFFPWLAPKFLQRLMMLVCNCKFDDIGDRIHSIWIPDVII